MKLGEIKFNSHKNHNPECDILEQKISSQAILTWGINLKTGKKFCEYYSGPNYVIGAIGKSYSRYFEFGKIPKKYLKAWLNLENIYVEKYIL